MIYAAETKEAVQAYFDLSGPPDPRYLYGGSLRNISSTKIVYNKVLAYEIMNKRVIVKITNK